jgi:hypothetical protein
MAQHPQSHLIATEVERLRALDAYEARREFSNRVGRTFQLRPEDPAFRLALDFNAHLVTLCRRRGVIWPQSK